jgi:hypothetical protein
MTTPKPVEFDGFKPISLDGTAGPPERDAKVLVSYWTLDCLLDWVFAHPDGSWSADDHYDQLRDEMDGDLISASDTFVSTDDLRAVLSLEALDWVHHSETEAAIDRLRGKVGEGT